MLRRLFVGALSSGGVSTVIRGLSKLPVLAPGVLMVVLRVVLGALRDRGSVLCVDRVPASSAPDDAPPTGAFAFPAFKSVRIPGNMISIDFSVTPSSTSSIVTAFSASSGGDSS